MTVSSYILLLFVAPFAFSFYFFRVFLNKFAGVLFASAFIFSLFYFQDSFAATTDGRKPTRVFLREGKIEPIPISIPNVIYNSLGEIPSEFDIADIGQQVVGVINNDLNRSGLIRVITPSLYREKVEKFRQLLSYYDWKNIGSRAVLVTEIGSIGKGQFALKIRLWDVELRRQILGLKYTANVSDWRSVAHKAADNVYSEITGEDPYFHSRIAMVIESGSKKSRSKRLAVMDSDGANLRYLTDGSSIVLTPSYSYDSHKVAYFTYSKTLESVLMLMDLSTGESRKLDMGGNKMLFAPSFSRDGKFMALSVGSSAGFDIYKIRVEDVKFEKIIESYAIDTSPSFSPDSNYIVFESDRSGSPQIYTARSDGSKMKRISFGRGRYGSPRWSPRGDKIAFTKNVGKKFQIGVMDTNGSNERIIAESFFIDGSTWSPNGRVIMFFKETPGGNGKSSIHTVDITGNFEQQMDLPFMASDPSWGPLL